MKMKEVNWMLMSDFFSKLRGPEGKAQFTLKWMIEQAVKGLFDEKEAIKYLTEDFQKDLDLVVRDNYHAGAREGYAVGWEDGFNKGLERDGPEW